MKFKNQNYYEEYERITIEKSIIMDELEQKWGSLVSKRTMEKIKEKASAAIDWIHTIARWNGMEIVNEIKCIYNPPNNNENELNDVVECYAEVNTDTMLNDMYNGVVFRYELVPEKEMEFDITYELGERDGKTYLDVIVVDIEKVDE